MRTATLKLDDKKVLDVLLDGTIHKITLFVGANTNTADKHAIFSGMTDEVVSSVPVPTQNPNDNPNVNPDINPNVNQDYSAASRATAAANAANTVINPAAPKKNL